jgi:hypothetical protein
MRVNFLRLALVLAVLCLGPTGCDQLTNQWQADKPAAAVQRLLTAFKKAEKDRIDRRERLIYPTESGLATAADYKRTFDEGKYLRAAEWHALGMDDIRIANASQYDSSETILLVWKSPSSDLSVVGLKNGEVHILFNGRTVGVPVARTPAFIP